MPVGRENGEDPGLPVRHADRRYSDLAVKFVLTLRALFRLPLRGCEGFAEDVLRLLECPDYTTLCRRGNPPHVRDENVRCIRKHGRKKWKEESGYHRRRRRSSG